MKSFNMIFCILVPVFAVEFAFAARQPEVPVRSARTLRQQVDSYAELLQKEVGIAKSTKDKYQALEYSLSQIRVLRENTPTQEISDEAHMDLIVTVLDSLPKKREFKKKDCAQYQNDFVNQYEPSAEEGPKEPAVKPAWDFLQSVCS